jgi:hypothetical protein
MRNVSLYDTIIDLPFKTTCCFETLEPGVIRVLFRHFDEFVGEGDVELVITDLLKLDPAAVSEFARPM